MEQIGQFQSQNQGQNQGQKFKNKEMLRSIYSRGIITRTIILPITSIGRNIKENIEKNISANYEGKCIVEGFIKPGSSKIISYSSGLIQRGINISFEVVFECEICFPVEGMLLHCIAKNITKAGIRAESADEIPSPIVVFIAKDHHYNVGYFSDIKEGDKFTASVIGQRFELNDKYISIIANLKKPKIEKETRKYNKPKIVIDEE
jgi:DNA-directed RNA polymerase subunit E'/Rpb7